MASHRIEYNCAGEVLYVDYVHKSDHRDSTTGKSQWRVDEACERQSFGEALTRGWQHGRFAWGLHRTGTGCDYLGVDRDHRTRVFIARFDRHTPTEWHGYPVGHREPRQRPPEPVLADWVRNRWLRAAQVRKIAQGQRCAL